MVNVNETDCNYESDWQEFGCKVFENVPPVSDTQDFTGIDLINILALRHMMLKAYKNKMHSANIHNPLYSYTVNINAPLKMRYCSE